MEMIITSHLQAKSLALLSMLRLSIGLYCILLLELTSQEVAETFFMD